MNILFLIQTVFTINNSSGERKLSISIIIIHSHHRIRNRGLVELILGRLIESRRLVELILGRLIESRRLVELLLGGLVKLLLLLGGLVELLLGGEGYGGLLLLLARSLVSIGGPGGGVISVIED